MSKLAKQTLQAAMIAAASVPLAAGAAHASYMLDTTIGIPATAANNQGGALTGFDISAFDSRGIYYLADRSNASIDIIDGATNQLLAQARGFAGQLSSTGISGPDGIAIGNANGTFTLYAGDGGSTLRSFNVTNPSAPAPLSTLNTGGRQSRVDEMALGPAGQLFVANNANTPAFGTIVNTSQPLTVAHGNILIPGQTSPTGGMEASVFDPATGTYFVAVPTFNGTDPGGVQEFSTTGTPLRTYNFAALSGGSIVNCSSSGIALGASGNLMVGCNTGSAQGILLNPAGAGSIVHTVPVSFTDELWYDPTTGNYYLTGTNAAGDRVIDVVSDATGALTQSIDLTSLGVGQSVNAHSVAVDPLNGDILVPLEGTVGAATDTLCPGGCVAVFDDAATPVPEPGSLPLVLASLAGLFGASGVLRRFASVRRRH